MRAPMMRPTTSTPPAAANGIDHGHRPRRPVLAGRRRVRSASNAASASANVRNSPGIVVMRGMGSFLPVLGSFARAVAAVQGHIGASWCEPVALPVVCRYGGACLPPLERANPSMPSPRRIDIHFHLIPQFYQDAVYEAGAGPAIGRYPDWSPELALELMDRSGIEVALMSLAQPGVQFGDPKKAGALARRCNEYSAELNARWPKRFGAFAMVPMWECRRSGRRDRPFARPAQAPGRLPVRELWREIPRRSVVRSGDGGAQRPRRRGVRASGAASVEPHARPAVAGLHDGISVRHHAGGGEPRVRRRDRALSAHPLRAGACRRADAVFRLAAVGVADDRQAARADVAGRRSTSGCGASGTTTRWRRPPRPWNASRRVAPPGQIVFGSDWPFANARVIAEAVKTYEGVAMPQDQRDAIDRGNALSLFPQFA